MKVIVINEDHHGDIGFAVNYNYAIDFLVKKDWLNENTGVWINHHGFLLKEVFSDWEKEIKNWNIKKFNDFFLNSFYLKEVEIYGADCWDEEVSFPPEFDEMATNGFRG